MDPVSMYVDMLTGALDAWDTELSGRALLDYVLDCRTAFLSSSGGAEGNAYKSLAAEIAYDRALIALCGDLGIVVSATDFADPGVERIRLEATLRDGLGVDLVCLSRGRAASAGYGSVGLLY